MTESDANSFEKIVADAHSGDALAQALLGYCYANGEDVPKDEVQAVFWWRKAAEQGLAAAQFRLGLAYRQGAGVPKDAAQACFGTGRRQNREMQPPSSGWVLRTT